jgi:WD40 repeat protein
LLPNVTNVMFPDSSEQMDPSVEKTPFATIFKLIKKLSEQRKILLDERKKLDNTRWQLHAELKAVDSRLTELVEQRVALVRSLEQLSEKDDALQKDIEELDQRLDSVFKEGKKFEDFIRKFNADEQYFESEPTCEDLSPQVTGSLCLHTFCGHSGGVLSLDFQPDFNILATGSSDKRVLLWNFSNNRLIAMLYGHTGWVHSVFFADRFLATGSGDCTICLWDLSSLQKCVDNGKLDSSYDINWQSEVHRNRQVLRGHHAGVSTLHGDLSTHTLMSGSLDKTIAQWDMEKGTQVAVMKGHEGGLLTMQTWQYAVVSGSSDSTIRLWDLRSKECQRVFRGHMGSVHSLQFDEAKLVSASSDHTVKLWDLRNGQCYEDLSLEGTSRALCFDEDLLVLSCEKNLYAYDMDTYQRQMRFQGHSSSVRDIILVDMGQEETKDCGMQERFSTRTSSLCSYAKSKAVVSASLDGTVKLWSV